MQINGVVFDLDHTLYDRYATLTALMPDFCDMLKDYIADGISCDEAARIMCEGDRKYIYYGWRRIHSFLCEKGLFATPPEYELYKSTLLKLFTLYAVPYPFTYSVLESIKARGFKTGLITNGRGDVQASKIKLLKLDCSFDEILLCGDFGIQKPDAAPFKEMARRLGVPVQTLLYVGDNPVCDVEGARAAGYIPVQVLTADCILPDAVPADYRISSVSELCGVIDEILKA